MTIQVHKPELTTLIQEHMAGGAYHDIEEALIHALRFTPIEGATILSRQESAGEDCTTARREASGKDDDVESNREESPEEVFAKIRGLADDLDFSRSSSLGRPVDLT